MWANLKKNLYSFIEFLFPIEIIDVALDLHGPSTQRHLAFVDKNKELYLARINSHTSANRIAKLGTPKHR